MSCGIGCFVLKCLNTTKLGMKIRKTCFWKGWDAKSILSPSKAPGGSHSSIYLCGCWVLGHRSLACARTHGQWGWGFAACCLYLGCGSLTVGLGHSQGLACDQLGSA